ncbi:uncharacterized protein LOC133791514 isoform X1 [Humulus lupulus]|uniref:uncharacterized protein LOC133791514 isoform X1 n=1 Tax=Humulus lupulus TaxID=3486 RepID=UPI002B40AE6F|nr:uncharacterized protein LOC133791514 isoform X1 [Humulus lupulus]
MENWSAEMEDMKKELFTIAMKGEWESVVKLYERNDLAHRTKITKSGDTALHVAVSDCQEEVIKALVRQVVLKSIAVLSIQNDRGNTPLHFAASIGNVTMCFCLAEADRSLVGVRNKDGETPLFLAALRGKKEAFLCLQSFCDPHHDGSYCRRHDGQTVLHCAISGEYFDLAFQIIHLYPKLVNSVDEHGLSPLHILASKPFAFKSGSNLGHWHSLIYHFMFVDELRPEPKSDLSLLMKRTKDEKKDSYPENYKSCVNFAQLLMHAIETVIIKKDVLLQKSTNHDTENPEALKVAQNTQHKGLQTIPGAQGHQLFPPNYATCFNLFKNLCKSLLIVLGFGSRMIQRIREKKEKHVWSVQILNELLKNASMYEYENTGASPEAVVQPLDEIDETKPYEIFESGDATFLRSMKLINPSTFDNPSKSTNQQENDHIDNQQGEKETAILIAAKNGVTEMVEKILELFPVAIHDMNSEKKNIVLLAVENRQPHVFKMLLKRNILKDSVFQQVDNKGNSALHLAAMLGDYKPWLIPGAALQMQWEIKWYEFVKTSMPPNFFVRYNENRKTAKDLFTETHKGLVQSGGEWLTNTSESCSVVAALIATVAFATSTAVPGGTNENSGKPILEDEPAFEIFAITSLVALCFSVTSVVMFLAILTSRYQEKDFGRDLPRKLLVGLTSLFVSIASMLVSFCAGHFFVLQEKLKYAAFPVYAITCLPVTFFALAQFPLYLDLIWANFKKVPQRSYKVALST